MEHIWRVGEREGRRGRGRRKKGATESKILECNTWGLFAHTSYIHIHIERHCCYCSLMQPTCVLVHINFILAFYIHLACSMTLIYVLAAFAVVAPSHKNKNC